MGQPMMTDMLSSGSLRRSSDLSMGACHVPTGISSLICVISSGGTPEGRLLDPQAPNVGSVQLVSKRSTLMSSPVVHMSSRAKSCFAPRRVSLVVPRGDPRHGLFLNGGDCSRA